MNCNPISFSGKVIIDTYYDKPETFGKKIKDEIIPELPKNFQKEPFTMTPMEGSKLALMGSDAKLGVIIDELIKNGTLNYSSRNTFLEDGANTSYLSSKTSWHKKFIL